MTTITHRPRVHKITDVPGFPRAVKLAAKIISIVFHPLFIPVYIAWFLLNETLLFANRDEWQRKLVLLQFAIHYAVYPLITIMVAKGLGFVNNITLRTQKDRIIPYIACGLFYFWIWYVLKNQLFPKEVVAFSLAIFLASSAGLIFNSYLKVSMHALAVGVAVTYIYLLSLVLNRSFGVYISIALFIGGLVCTARMINSDHNSKEVYTGLALGVLAQLVAWWIVVN